MPLNSYAAWCFILIHHPCHCPHRTIHPLEMQRWPWAQDLKGVHLLQLPQVAGTWIFGLKACRAHLVQVWPRRRGGRSWGLVWHRWWAASQREEMPGVRWETVWRAVVEPNAVCLRLFLESEPFKQSRNEDSWLSMAQRCHNGLDFSLVITPYHTPRAQSSYFTIHQWSSTFTVHQNSLESLLKYALRSPGVSDSVDLGGPNDFIANMFPDDANEAGPHIYPSFPCFLSSSF